MNHDYSPVAVTNNSRSLLHYKGRITFERIGVLLNELKNKKDQFNVDPVLYKKLLTLMIEILENILKYSDYFEKFTDSSPEHLPEFELIANQENYFIITRNPVLESTVDKIRDRIDRINNSDLKTLKEYYRETITNGQFTEKGGAGLGFIEMAKTTLHPLEYFFIPAGEGYFIFQLKLKMKNKS